MSPLTVRVTVAVLTAAMLASGCKKKPPPPPPAPPPQAVEVKLQVTSMSPSSVEPDAATTGKIYGSSFANGAAVQFVGPSDAEASAVNVDSANTLSVTIPPLPVGTYDVSVVNPDGESSTLRGGLTVKVTDLTCRNVTVQFDYNSPSVRRDARSTLDGQMSCFQALTSDVRIEGHCDARGTVDYNVALGQRRAESVKSYLVGNGVAASRIKTVSYGEERPVDRSSNESAWAKNRRAELSASE